MTDKVELLAGYWTIAGNIESFTGNDSSPFNFRARVEAAARAGYTGMGLKHADIKSVAARYGLTEMNSILSINGMKHIEIEALFDWFTEGERRRQSDLVRRDLLKAAERLGARHIKVVGDLTGGNWPLQQMAECFEILCGEAANAGAMVGLEIIPFSNVRNLDTALAIVRETGARNGGVLLDIWHINRGGIGYDELTRIPGDCIISVELNDASLHPVGSLLEDTLHRRKLCGQGDFDVPGFIRSVLHAGYDGPFGVEVISEEHRMLPLADAANQSFLTTMRQFSGILE